jgi:serine/threonine protein kinase
MVDDDDDGEDDLELLDDERTWEELVGDALSPGDVLADKYRVDELIGYGAMGFVLKAWHLQLDEPVAVKFLLPGLAASEEALVRFEREARAAFKIKSEHVARVLDVGRLDTGLPFLVMEYLEGEEFSDRIYGGPMPVSELVDFILQACDAIAEAHALGIVHRDIKPDNLFLTERRDGTIHVKVLDFGLSKIVPRTSSAKRERALTADAQVMGTAHYMSPEQWVASKDVGPSADIWAIGVILYEGLTGESPFMRTNLAAMCNAVLREEPTGVCLLRKDAPIEIENIVNRCLKKAADERYTSIGELAADLAPFASEPSAVPHSVSAWLTAHDEPSFADEPTEETQDVAPTSRVNLRPAGVSPLGLLNPDGTVDMWADILAEAPPRSSRSVTIAVVVIVAAVVMALLASVAI